MKWVIQSAAVFYVPEYRTFFGYLDMQGGTVEDVADAAIFENCDDAFSHMRANANYPLFCQIEALP